MIDKLFSLSGKTAMVTGGASGLGKAMAVALAGAGADVAVADINRDSSAVVANEIQAMGRRALALQVDVTSATQLREATEECVREFGHLDILVNSAGVTVLGTPMIDMEEKDWNKIIDINLKGTFLSNQTVARQMIKQGYGRIINVGSMSSVIVNRNTYGSSGVYCASKAGVAMLTKAFAADLAKHGITVNAISPGYMKTPLVEGFWKKDPAGYAEKMAMVPMGIPGDPEDLEGLVVFLASDSSRYMTGVNVLIDGGYTIW
jgi:gluconate 5-dehydrogenase